MNVLICHERFLFRFGADRMLMMLGTGLKRLGHTVTVMAERCDRSIVDVFASRTIGVPAGLGDYLNRNELTATWLRDMWRQHFDDSTKPDLVLVGGWPFLSSISFLVQVCPRVAFVDFGVVPPDGYSESTQVTLAKLRELRRQHLPDASLIVAISDFIARSQSQPDAQGRAAVRSILLGADHMEMSIWPAERLEAANASGMGLESLRSLKRQGRKVILCLGRWEPGCYKNSEAALDVLERIRVLYPECTLLILSGGSGLTIPPSLTGSVFPVGFPDDRELLEIMRQVDLGISPSLWEGFNLPVAEMQWQDRPALAFHLAAHPEVIAHPWYLCRDNAEMAGKACELLAGRGPGPRIRSQAIEKFREHFTWQRAIEEYRSILMTEIETPASVRSTSAGSSRRRWLVIDVSNSTRDPANSGVIRVTRRLSQALQEYEDPLFVVWDSRRGRYVMPTKSEFDQLSKFQGPVLTDRQPLSTEPDERTPLEAILSSETAQQAWLLLPEVIRESDFADGRRAAGLGLKTAAIFYDAIPVLRPDLCNEDVRNNHWGYMLGLAACDLVVSISHFSTECLRRFWNETNSRGPEIVTNVLPGEFGGSDRRRHVDRRASDTVKILCVSTIEPRKNHRTLIRACLLMHERHPGLKWSLTLVGNRYADSAELAEYIEQAAAQNPRIRWLGVVDDSAVHQLYREADFTVYPSLIEGFGLPILESLWHGTPCICHHGGVMGELATGGGCLTVDVTDEKALEQAIYALGTDLELQSRLGEQAVGRNIKTWDDYIVDLLRSLRSNPVVDEEPRLTSAKRVPAWTDIVYPHCLMDNWQMFDSERLALTAILSRQQPRCSIEVGTYRGGSLSLISQYSEMVFSIDPDPSVARTLSFLANVAFLTGYSYELLPRLLRELDRADIPPEFLLIDADHTAEGVKRDIACLLDYVPKRPLFVMLHDSFNPECRRGMREAGWERSPYLHWLDEDFVPGRIVEHDGPTRGQLWGGLAFAYFAPAKRTGEPARGPSAQLLFDIVSSSPAASVSAVK